MIEFTTNRNNNRFGVVANGKLILSTPDKAYAHVVFEHARQGDLEFAKRGFKPFFNFQGPKSTP